MNLPGLLSGDWTADPDQNKAIRQGLLSAAFSLMGAKGSFGNALGQAGAQGMQSMQQVMQQARENKLRDLQMQDMQQRLTAQTSAAERQKRVQALQQQFVKPGAKPDYMDDRDVGQPGEAPIPARSFDYNGYVQALAGEDPMGALQLQSALQKDDTPIALPDGGMLVTRTGRKLAENSKSDKEDPFIRSMRLIGIDPTSAQGQQMVRQWLQKQATHAPGTNVTLNTAKNLNATLAETLGKQVDSSFSSAKSAMSSIETAHRLKAAVDSGKLVAGPGAQPRVIALQLGQMLGINGKDENEVLANTRTVIQSMAQAELDAAQQMKGQGQITEAERDIVRRAASGDISSLTAPEVRLLADALEKTGRGKIRAHVQNVERLKGLEGAAPLVPFYQLTEPDPYAAPPGGGGWGIRKVP